MEVEMTIPEGDMFVSVEDSGKRELGSGQFKRRRSMNVTPQFFLKNETPADFSTELGVLANKDKNFSLPGDIGSLPDGGRGCLQGSESGKCYIEAT